MAALKSKAAANLSSNNSCRLMPPRSEILPMSVLILRLRSFHFFMRSVKVSYSLSSTRKYPPSDGDEGGTNGSELATPRSLIICVQEEDRQKRVIGERHQDNLNRGTVVRQAVLPTPLRNTKTHTCVRVLAITYIGMLQICQKKGFNGKVHGPYWEPFWVM
jgi:hypothetical protein